MKEYYADKDVTLWHGDCVAVMRGMDDNSVHAIVTDPPYALNFMGKSWDRFIEQDADYLPLIAERIRRGKAQGHQTDLFGGAA